MVLRIGHRGAAGYEPENTIRSFARAVSLGVDMVELDVHICASGELVVIHDESVDRTTDGQGRVADLTLHELKSLDAGKCEMIPTLEEVFSAMRGHVGINVELKGIGTAEPVNSFLTTLAQNCEWSTVNVLVTSFDWKMISRMREFSRDTRLGLLAHEDVEEALTTACELSVYSINPFHARIDRDYVNRSHNAGLMVYPWTVNQPVDIRRVSGLGVDGIISDFPDKI
jgi:glycerophosphoryl diester phosphodiesterase